MRKMKKTMSILLSCALCACLVAMTGCSSKTSTPYDKYDLSEYITLPDYSKYTTGTPDVKITDDDINAEIQSRLEANPTTKEVKKGTVKEGDKVRISFKGTLADGTTKDGMSSDSSEITLGSANMIDGFQEGLYGATIGEPVTLNLQFPDPYPNDEDLSGKDVTFEVTVLCKLVEETPELNEEFVQANSEAKTVAEYKKLVKEDLEEEETQSQLTNFKNEIWTEIVDNTEVIKYPEEEVQAEMDTLDESYKKYAKDNNIEWETVLKDSLQMTQEEYDEQLKSYGEGVVKQKMIVYALQKQEDVEFPQDRYDEILKNILTSSGVDDEQAFEDKMGMSLEEYAESYNGVGVKVSLTLDAVLDSIYDKLEKK